MHLRASASSRLRVRIGGSALTFTVCSGQLPDVRSRHTILGQLSYGRMSVVSALFGRCAPLR